MKVAHNAAADPARYQWVDAAKGACMILVVLFHAAGRFQYDLGTTVTGAWVLVSSVFSPIRMPLFFFVSGFLAASALGRPLSLARGRTWGFVYLYALWTLLFLPRVIPDAVHGDMQQPWGALLSFVLPTTFWYLYALPLYFVLAWALMKALRQRSVYALIPLFLLSATAFLLQPASNAILTDPWDPAKIPDVLRNFVWFYLAVHSKPLWISILRTSSPEKAVAATAAYAGLYWAAAANGLTDHLRAPLSIGALYMCALLLGLWGGQGRIGVAIQKVGRQTLPVYVLHIFLMPVIMAAISATGLSAVMKSSPDVWNAIAPPLVTLIVVYLTYQGGRLVLASHLAWLFSIPRWITGAPTRATLAAR